MKIRKGGWPRKKSWKRNKKSIKMEAVSRQKLIQGKIKIFLSQFI